MRGSRALDYGCHGQCFGTRGWFRRWVLLELKASRMTTNLQLAEVANPTLANRLRLFARSHAALLVLVLLWEIQLANRDSQPLYNLYWLLQLLVANIGLHTVQVAIFYQQIWPKIRIRRNAQHYN